MTYLALSPPVKLACVYVCRLLGSGGTSLSTVSYGGVSVGGSRPQPCYFTPVPSTLCLPLSGDHICCFMSLSLFFFSLKNSWVSTNPRNSKEEKGKLSQKAFIILYRSFCQNSSVPISPLFHSDFMCKTAGFGSALDPCATDESRACVLMWMSRWRHVSYAWCCWVKCYVSVWQSSAFSAVCILWASLPL